MTLTKQAQAYAMAYRTLGAGAAQIVTPLIVGALSNPCEQWGWSRGCGPGGFFQDRPFALTAIFVAGVGTMATLANFFTIPDLRTKNGAPVASVSSCCGWLVSLCTKRKTKESDVQPAAADTITDARSASLPLPPVKPLPPSVVAASDPAIVEDSLRRTTTPPVAAIFPPADAPVRRFASMPAAAFRRTASTVAATRAGLARSRTFARAQSMVAAAPATLTAWGRDGFAGAGLEGDMDLDAAVAAASVLRERRRLDRLASGIPLPPLPAEDAESGGAFSKPKPWFRHRPALLSIMAYAAVTLLFDPYLDLVYLYGSAPHDASAPGLALPLDRLSWIMSLGGACVVAFSLLAYHHIQRAVGVARCARYGLAAGIPTALIPATAYYVYDRQKAALGILAAGQVLYGLAMALTSTSSQILTNLCSPDGQIGAVNGAGNMLSALARVAEPSVIGGLWALAATDNFPDQWLPWGVLAGLFALTVLLYVLSGLKDEDVDAADVGA